MADRIIEEHVHSGGGGNGALTAVAIVVLMVVLLLVLYFTGVLSRMFGPRDTKIDVDINKPGIILKV